MEIGLCIPRSMGRIPLSELTAAAAEILIPVDECIECRRLRACRHSPVLEESYRFIRLWYIRQAHLLSRSLYAVVHKPICERTARLRADKQAKAAHPYLIPGLAVVHRHDDPMPDIEVRIGKPRVVRVQRLV